MMRPNRTVRQRADARHVVVCAFVLVSALATVSLAGSPDLDPRITKLIQSVSQDRLVAILKKLDSFGTRNTLSSPD